MILYPLLFILIIKTKGLFRWTCVGDLLAYEAKGGNFYKYISFGLMIIYACVYCVIPLCLKADNRNPLFTDISALFGLAFCICVSLAYFVQLRQRALCNRGRIRGLNSLLSREPKLQYYGQNNARLVCLVTLFHSNYVRYLMLAAGIHV
jgi:hypothetical protein